MGHLVWTQDTHTDINRQTKFEEDDVPDSDMEEYVGVSAAATENPHVTKRGKPVCCCR